MSADADLLVLGAGIAGLTTALAAAERQMSVDRDRLAETGRRLARGSGDARPGRRGGAAGHARRRRSPRETSIPTFLDALRERTGIEVPLDRQGILQLAPDGEADRLRANVPAGSRWLDEGALRELEPALEGQPGALLHPVDGAVDNVALMDALERAVDLVPGIKRVAAEILSVDSDQPSALTRTRGRFFARRLVLATGAWAAGIPGLPRRIPVRPVRGELLRLAQCPVHHVTYGGGGYLVPRGDTLLVGATSEEAGFENETSLAGLAALRHIAARVVPSLSAAVVADHWAGLRPMSLDGHPILGPDPDSPPWSMPAAVAKRDPVRPLGRCAARRRARRRPGRRPPAIPRRPAIALRYRRLTSRP